MKKIYFASLALLTLTACSKDFLKRYDDRIQGSWYISQVKRLGIGGDFNDLPFREGSFTFNGDGTLTYTDELENRANRPRGRRRHGARRRDAQLVPPFAQSRADLADFA
jgi:hypothetical protein